MDSNNHITVVFLMWVPNGFEKFKTFMTSYLRHSAGIEHDLLIVFNECSESKEELQPYYSYLKTENILYKELFFAKGMDLDAYFFAAPKIDTEFVTFINNNSIILGDNWLLKLYAGFQYENIGAIGCTGSNQSLYNTVFSESKWYWETTKSFLHNYRKYKMYLKAFFYWRFFVYKPFPNPHLRTNAFIIRRSTFLNIRKKETITKSQAYQFESGKMSFTNQLLKMGFEILVVGKDGQYYKQADWPISKTFMSGQQENLLVADKQTIRYEEETAEEQQRLTKLTWGS